jgi:murein L,D-transpeptidase YcbB/YkuD
VDGVVGRGTRSAMNVPARDRLRQVNINLERWRWLPDQLGARHIEVNIPGFEVRVVEQGEVVATHRAVVGRPYRATPMFSGTITYLVLAPYWHVPPTIAAQDKLPAIKADPGVIARDRMTLLELGTDTPVDPATVDWASMTGAELNRRYRLRQDPGAFNALGHVKFMFPNRHNVYLHDTPSRDLFERTARDFSSGCIRVDRAMELAEFLLRDRPGWTRDRIDETVRAGVERTVPLVEPLPVHLLYWTAWMDEEDVPHFREDIYGRDEVVWRALTAPPPVD